MNCLYYYLHFDEGISSAGTTSFICASSFAVFLFRCSFLQMLVRHKLNICWYYFHFLVTDYLSANIVGLLGSIFIICLFIRFKYDIFIFILSFWAFVNWYYWKIISHYHYLLQSGSTYNSKVLYNYEITVMDKTG